MRPPLLALGAAGALAVLLTGCGGGGGSHAALPAPAATAPATDPSPNQFVNNTNGPTGKMTVTIKVPKTTPASAALKAQAKAFGPKHANARIRQLANTSPSATIRAIGQQRNAYAKRVQTSTGRSPLFVDGSTDEVELLVTDPANNNNVLTDETAGCQSEGSCTLTFDVGVGSNLTVSILTYDDCDYLLAAGSVTGVTITTGLNPQQTITLNGVVANFGLTSSATQFISDVAGSQAQPSFGVTAVPMDADNNVITAPGTLIDESFLPITSIAISPFAIDNSSFAEQVPTPHVTSNITPAGGQTVNTSGATFPPATFAYSGTGSDVNEQFLVTEASTGTSVLPPVFIDGAYCCGIFPTAPGSSNPPVGILQQAVTPALAWNAPTGATNNPQFAGQTSFGLWIAEFPTTAPQSGVNFSLYSNLPGYNGNINLSDDAESGCSDFSPAPAEGTQLYSAVSSSGYTFGFTPASNETCQFIITDDFGNMANLELAIDNTNVTVQRKARKH